MKPCPKCGSIDIEIESKIGVKLSGNIVETIIRCNSCGFDTPSITLWSEDQITEDSDIFKKSELETWAVWDKLHILKSGE